MTWRLPSVAFGLKRDGQALESVTVENAIVTGITAGLELPGLVPPYEEFSAMAAAHYNEGEWEMLSADKRARAVAHWRLGRLLQLHEQDVAVKKAKQHGRRV